MTLYERDDLPDGPANRTAVPQGKHVHLLMARGAQEFESLFPGLLDGMVADGVPILENRPDCIHFGAAGHVLGTAHRLQDEFTAYVPSRPQLEWQIRRRALAIDNVELVNAGVTEPSYDAGRGRVTGVLLDSGEQVAADLVIDATGRGTRLPAWLQKWGYERPHEDTVDVGIAYASQRVRIPDGLLAEKVVVAGASSAQPLGVGMLFYEDGVWDVTTFGVGKVEPPQNFPQICDLADQILPAHVASALRVGKPLDEMAFHKYPTSRWRRYDKLDRFPDGIAPFGDAVVSFNPTFGQGMTMTAIQAGNLRDVLAAGDADLAGRLSKATAKTTWPVWAMTAIGDLALHNATGEIQVVVQAGRRTVRPVPRGRRDGSRSRPNGFCAGSAFSTASTWCRRRGSSAAPCGTTCACGSPKRRAARQGTRERVWSPVADPRSVNGHRPIGGRSADFVDSLFRPLDDIAACGIPYWLPPGGMDNGVWADTWELITDLDSGDVSNGSRVARGGGRRWLCRGAGRAPRPGPRPGSLLAVGRCNAIRPRRRRGDQVHADHQTRPIALSLRGKRPRMRTGSLRCHDGDAMSAGLFGLLDDVAALARLAAASVDDIGAATGRATAKAAGVVIDDTAVTPQYVHGITADRELPMIKRIAIGSLRNKLVFILPAALLLSQFVPWLVTPILMLGATYLCYEGAEKVWGWFRGITSHNASGPTAVVGEDAEKQMTAGAIRTDFILSAEIMVIALNEVADQPLLSRLLILVGGRSGDHRGGLRCGRADRQDGRHRSGSRAAQFTVRPEASAAAW